MTVKPTSGVRRTIIVVVKGYPRLSETFIAQELRGLEKLGFCLVIVSLRHPTDQARHPVHDEMEAPLVYLPEYIHQETGRVARALLKVLLRRGFWRALGAFSRDLARDPTRNRFRRFCQAAVLSAEMPAGAGYLYAHFIHTPTAVTRYAAMMSAMTFAVSAHAKDIWTSPDWELSQNLADASWVTTCTKVGARHLQALSAAPGRVHLIYHGLNLDRFPSPPPDADTRDGTDPAHPVRLLSVGRAVEKKGYADLLHALSALPDGLHWRFEHIGGGGGLGALKALGQQLGLADRITWSGARAQDDVRAAYRRADLFILPSKIAADGDRDGLPNVLVEAQSQRLACLSTSVSAIPEFIEDGVTGCLVPPAEPDRLADAITSLARDPARRAALARAGEARVRTEFDAEQGLAALARLFPNHVQPQTLSNIPGRQRAGRDVETAR